MSLDLIFLENGALASAPLVLGMTLIHKTADGITAGRIVETEAYHQEDPASHTFRGPTARNKSMFKEAGHAYVYFTYGMHWCLNIVCGPEGRGEAVLIRALEPLEGVPLMQDRRHQTKLENLASGPAKLTQAMGITKAQDGAWLGSGNLRLEGTPYTGPYQTGPRIGISLAKDEPWRFWLPNSPFLSRRELLG